MLKSISLDFRAKLLYRQNAKYDLAGRSTPANDKLSLFVFWYQDGYLVVALIRQGQKGCLWEVQCSIWGTCSYFRITPLRLTQAHLFIYCCMF